jgi:hypothetical protein
LQAAVLLSRSTRLAFALGKHSSTTYRWIEDYERTERLSVFLRKERSDRGKSRLPNKVNAIIESAMNKIYLKAEQPDVAAVIEEVQLQCFKANIKKPRAARRFVSCYLSCLNSAILRICVGGILA